MGRNNSIIHQTITYIEENLHEELTMKSGSHPFNYKMSVDQKVFHRGKGSGLMTSFRMFYNLII